jgi:hypothetical protein
LLPEDAAGGGLSTAAAAQAMFAAHGKLLHRYARRMQRVNKLWERR